MAAEDRIIFGLEIDGSRFTSGLDPVISSTQRFAEVQRAANRALEILEQTLKEQSSDLDKAKRALESYTGADEKHRQQLQKTFNDQKANNDRLKTLVAQARTEYEKATKAAQDFANTSARANGLQGQPGARIAPQIPSAPAGISAQIFNAIDLTEMAELAEVTARTRQEFDELRDSITLAEERLRQLDPATEEFKQLAPIVEQGKKALQEYDQAASSSGEATQSLRTQIRLGRDELVRLEEQGKGNTKEYIELEKRVAKLTDAFQDQQQRIRILASDTKLLDFGKGAITAATSAFQAYTAVSILAGDESEELQKKTMQLFAAMQLLQSLEQLSNLTRREGVLATLAQSAAQSSYTAVVGASTGALRGFRLALAATGIGAAIAAITFLVIKFNELGKASAEAAARQKALTEIGQEAASSFAAEVTHLDLIKTKLNDLSIPQKERVRLAKEYNKTADESNKIDLKQIDSIAQINKAIDTQIVKIKERALARAAETVIAQKAEAVFRLQAEIAAKSPEVDPNQAATTKRLQAEQKVLDDRLNTLIQNRTKVLGIKPISTGEILALSGLSDEQIEAGAKNSDKLKILLDKATRDQVRDINLKRNQIATAGQGINEELRGLFDDLNKAEADLQASLKFGADFITIDSLFKQGKLDTKSVENIFAQKLRELQAKLAEVTAKSFESEGTIRAQFTASLQKEIAALNDLVKDKKLTGAQAEILIQLTTRINDVQLNEALNQFNKKVTDARNKLNEELITLQLQNTEESIQLLQDEFERRGQLIDFNEREAIRETERNTAERLAALEEQRDLIGEQVYQDAKNRIVQAGEDAQTNIIIQASQDRQQLAADSFRDSLQLFERMISEADLLDDQDSAKKIRELSNQFLRQKITFEQFQKELEKIEKDYEAKKRNRDLNIYKDELTALDIQIARTEDKTSKHYQELLRLRDDLAKKIAAKETEDAVKDAEDQNEATPRPVSTIVDYANSIGQLTDSIVQFWQAANDAETAALDRSIALQERRVDAAQRIAERGNAQYLKAEEDRLRELELARENAARRQLAIDAALQASQVLVGITGAIAKIATPGIGIAETIGAIAVIVGALATGYGIVKSLQGVQPRLFKGTKYLEREGHPSGRDTIPAMLNEGEAVIPTDVNKKYHPAISAIYDKKIPPDVINNFVKNYHTIKPVPQPNYQRIKEAAEINVSHDGKMAVVMSEQNRLIQENNDLQRQTLRAMKAMGINLNIDKNGLALSVMEVAEKIKIDQKI